MDIKWWIKEVYIMKKYLFILCLFICVFVVTACKKEEVSNNDALKPVFNFEMRDVDGNVKINADDVQEVKIVEEDFGEDIECCIKVCFTEEGGEKLKKVTTELVGKELAIYAGEELISRPIINCPIEGGEAIISGFDSYDEAEKSLNLIIGKNSDIDESESSKIKLKITENDGTILVTEEDVECFYSEYRSIGKGGSSVEVIVIVFTEEGKATMAKKTKKLIGEEINLVVNGELLYDVMLDESIDNGEWLLYGNDIDENKYNIIEKLEEVID